MEVIRSFETSVLSTATRRHIPENGILLNVEASLNATERTATYSGFSCAEIYDSLVEEEQDIKEEHPYLSQPLCYTSLPPSQIIPHHPATVTLHEISRLLRIYPRDKTPLPTLPTHSAANKLTQIYLSSSTHQFYRPNPSGTVGRVPFTTSVFRDQNST
jgi:hypothetical protein